MGTKAIYFDKTKYVKEAFQVLSLKGVIIPESTNYNNVHWCFKYPGLKFDDKTNKLKLDFTTNDTGTRYTKNDETCLIKGKLTLNNETAYLVHGSTYDFSSGNYYGEEDFWIQSEFVKILGGGK